MKTLVTYASIGGNTMMVAQKIEELLKQKGHQVSLVDMSELKVDQLTQYELVFIGSSTWGDGEYNDFSQAFFDQLKASSTDLSNVKCAVYGLGESFYPVFCNVVSLMNNDLTAKKAQIVGDSLKIDGFPDDVIMQSVEAWVENILSGIK